MKTKLIGTIIVIMLFMPVLSAFGDNNINIIEAKIKKSNIEEQLSIVINPARFFLGVNLDIQNNGEATLKNVHWSFRTKAKITGTRFFLKEKLQEGIIDQIDPGEIRTLEFRLFSKETKSPLGLGNVYMNASAAVDGISVGIQQRAVLLFFFLIMYRDTYKDIKPAEVYYRWLNDKFDLIIDVVGLDIYNLGHIPDAVNYIWVDGTLNSKIPELDPSWTYLVYCHTDPPSTASAQALVNAGFKHVYRLEGNFEAWKNAGYPVET